MAQPVWITPVGSLGVIPETKTYRNNVVASDPDGGSVTYSIIAGTLPNGIQFNTDGLVSGTPTVVDENITSRFTVRAVTTNLPRRISDRTFSLTITGNNTPMWVTPAGSLGTFYSGNKVDLQFTWDDNDPNDVVVVKLAAGQLPGGLTLTSEGLLTGYIQPAMDLSGGLPGYGNTGQDTQPYDFVADTVNKNYEFTLEVTDGTSSDLRTFYMFVYTRQSLTADTTVITADNTIITADETNLTAPYLANAAPSDLGIYRSNNYYAYQFVGEDYSGAAITYAISVNQGYGLPPGLVLDASTGWYYGYIPDQGATEVEYSFNIVAYQSEYLGTPIVCTQTQFGTNVITCNSTAQIEVGQPIVFTGTAFGGIIADPTQVYYVSDIVSKVKFTVTTVLGSTTNVNLTTASGSMQAHLILASEPYPFTLTLVGTVESEVTWITDADLGVIDNGQTSILNIQAVNRGGRTLFYRLKSGAYNSLPQGLELLPSGDISGRVSFNGFSLDLGTTTFDETYSNNRNITSLGTTFDSTFRFTVNAYAPESLVPIYKVRSLIVENGGTGYSSVNPPTIRFSTPVGASAVVAEAGNVVISNGAIVSVEVAEPGDGYTSAPTITVIDPYGGEDAVLTPIMQLSGSRDVVSVYKEFYVRVFHRWDKPYQNLLLRAMPPVNDRQALYSFLHDENIFVPEWIYRPSDPFFGIAKNVTFAQTYGLLPESLDLYVSSLYLNHYWKNLVLGSIKTAQAVDASGNVVYEVVYSDIIDNLVNNDGVSVGKIVNLPYPIDSYVPTAPWIFSATYTGNTAVLMNDNFTVIALGTNSDEPSSLGTHAIETGDRVMFSVTIDVWPQQNNFTGIGVANHSAAINTWIGSDEHGIGLYDDGYVYTDDSELSTGLPVFGYDGAVVDVAVDRINDLIWWRVDGGDWNNSTTDNPTTAQGGIDISSISGSLYPAFSPYNYNGTAGRISLNNRALYATPLGYTFLGENDIEVIRQVYPNSLTDMRTQVVDVVGQVGDCGDVPLPLWMTSEQTNGRVLGFIPAWVIAYTVPGRSDEIAYYINTKWSGHLNDIDFTVDRYILDSELSRHWDPETQQWVPTPGNITTFDRYGYTQPLNPIGNVSIATELAYVDINNQTLAYINGLGGLDGVISQINGSTLIFPKQENYEPPLPGNYPEWNIAIAYPDSVVVTHNNLYYTALHDMPAGIDIDNLYYWYPGMLNTDAAWQDYRYPFDTYGFSELPDRFDEAVTIPGGDKVECYRTYADTNLILCDFTAGLLPGQEIVFVENVFDGITAGQIYYVLEVPEPTLFTITETQGSSTPVTLTDQSGLMIADAANQRMGIFTISVDPTTTIVTLELTTQTDPYDWVQIQRGASYAGASLYYPEVPEQGYQHVAWQPVVPDVETGTTFDGGSMQFIDPVDMYDPGEEYDKYLVFPRTNILV